VWGRLSNGPLYHDYFSRVLHLSKLRDLKGLGPKSEMLLIQVGISTEEELREIGAIRAFIRLKKECSTKPSLNFLYALVGALEGEHWLNIAKHEKGQLIMELEGYEELEELFNSEGVTLEI
jgi:DNA transformation protein